MLKTVTLPEEFKKRYINTATDENPEQECHCARNRQAADHNSYWPLPRAKSHGNNKRFPFRGDNSGSAERGRRGPLSLQLVPLQRPWAHGTADLASQLCAFNSARDFPPSALSAPCHLLSSSPVPLPHLPLPPSLFRIFSFFRN